MCGHPPYPSRAARLRGFTLMELLIVIAIIMILVALTAPALMNARDAGWMSVCASNLSQIHQLMLGTAGVDEHRYLPETRMWMSVVGNAGGADVRVCPKGSFSERDETDLQDIYFVQNGNTFNTLQEILDGGLQGVSDPQIGYIYQGVSDGDFGESGPTWPAWSYARSQYTPDGAVLSPDDIAVVFNDDGGCVVELSQTPVRIIALDPPSALSGQPDFGVWTGTNSGGDMGCGSNHWVCKGDQSNWQAEVILRMTGNGYQNHIDAPIEVAGGVASYGMNSEVRGTISRPGQVLMLDYRKTTVVVTPENHNYIEFFDDDFAPRHFDKANVMFVDGSVQAMSRGELDPETVEGQQLWRFDVHDVGN
jgi:prepilin-type N-terminal cleavage/methylation domain-containing protein/prepilin-type processing-associated H-X9-DG protein